MHFTISIYSMQLSTYFAESNIVAYFSLNYLCHSFTLHSFIPFLSTHSSDVLILKLSEKLKD